MKAHSSKHLNAERTPMALAAVGLQGLLRCAAEAVPVTRHVSGKVTQQQSLHRGNGKGSPSSQPYPQPTKPRYLKQNQY